MQAVRIRVEGSAAKGYVVQLVADSEREGAGGPPSAHIPADLDAGNAPEQLADGAVDEAVRAFLQANPDSIHFGEIGEFLGRLLLRDDVAEAWDVLRNQQQAQLRVLLDIEPPALRLVPWELMSRDQGRLFLDEDVVFARVDNLRDDPTSELVPLRLLVVEGTRDVNIGTLTEMREIKAALPAFQGRIDAEFLSEPTPDELSQAFRRVRPHIFHFMGHGVRDPADKRQPALQIRDWMLTRQFIMDRFLTPSPRLVVLNACRSGDVEGVRSLTEALFARGAVAVIAMQSDVRGQAAGRFGSELYKRLAARISIDRAVAGARREVLTKGGNNQARDWCLPSLTLRVQPEQVLPFVCGIGEQDEDLVERNLFKEVRLFVDRSDKRWELAENADPDRDQGPPERVVVIAGDTQVGKTALVNWVRTRCALRGRRVRYVSFKSENSLNFAEALGVIAATPEDIPSLAGPIDAFDRFNYDVGFLVHGRIPPDPSGDELPRTFPEVPASLQLGGGNDERILESFRSALERSTADDPMLIVFDHLGKLSAAEFQKWIFPYLIQPIADGDLPGVRLLVVLSNEHRREYWPAESTVGRELHVDAIPVKDYPAWAEDVILALTLQFDERDENLIAAMRSYISQSFKPTELDLIVRAVGGR